MAITIDDSSYGSHGTNVGWTTTTITINNIPYVVTTQAAVNGEVRIYRVNSDGTFTQTDQMNMVSSTGTVTTTSSGDISATVNGDADSNFAIMGNTLHHSNIFEVDGKFTLFLTSQNGTGISAWEIDANGEMTYVDGIKFGGSQSSMDGGIVRESSFYEGSDGTNYLYAPRPQNGLITKFTYENGEFVEVGTVSSSATSTSSLDQVSVGGTDYLVASTATGPQLYYINPTNGDLTLVDSENHATSATTGNAIEVMQNDSGDTYVLYSNLSDDTIFAYRLDASSNSLVLTDTLTNVNNYMMTSGEINGKPVFSANHTDGTGTGIYSLDANGNFVLEDSTTDISEGTTSPVFVTTSDGSVWMVDADGSLQSVKLLCFAKQTLISTKTGDRAVADLKVGDMVLTADHGYQPIRWIGKRKFDAIDFKVNPKFRPVQICAGALGSGFPKQDLVVSRQHRMLVESRIVKRLFDTDEVLVPAIKLTELPGIYVDEQIEEVEYFHMLFDQHEVIYANGTPSESLFTGPEALKALPPESRDEITRIFPEILELDYTPQPAKPFIEQQKIVDKMIMRHVKNNVPFVKHIGS